ncbi:hypothetical protein OPIT5_24565 [Opitutaceae bacterium TAV5]|nr:hypothetical protein OPIT5_24565 [Opitutaceae bacterium TAV5]
MASGADPIPLFYLNKMNHSNLSDDVSGGVAVLPDSGEGTELRERALQAARRGLDFIVRNQVTDVMSADCGRFAYIYDCREEKALSRTTNWITGVGIEALLTGYQVFGDERYLASAGRAVEYLRSLQEFSPTLPRFFGTFHEDTPQTDKFHPRDALTAAWALLDWSVVADDGEARTRAGIYADWLIEHGMDAGYPRWTVSYRTFDAFPRWHASFHSGSAFFYARMYAVTGETRYLETMRSILDLYNRQNLMPDGSVRVMVDIERRVPLADDEVPHDVAPVGWIRMHEYNDDFGALANVEAWRLTGKREYLEAAERFLRHMMRSQRTDGGFGPGGAAGYSIPAAGGSVLVEMLAARACGSDLPMEEAMKRAAEYVLGLQVVRPGSDADGAFRGFTKHYTLDPDISNLRSGGYAIMGLLRFAGAVSPVYFSSSELPGQGD